MQFFYLLGVVMSKLKVQLTVSKVQIKANSVFVVQMDFFHYFLFFPATGTTE